MNSLRTLYPILMHGYVVYSWRRHPDVCERLVEMKKMTSVTAINKIDHGLADSSKTPTQQALRRWTAGLFVSAFFGVVSGFGGLALGFLTTGGLIVSSTSFYAIGTLLVGASFTLFGLAAHCLDKADAADKAIRVENCRQQLLGRSSR